jgi:hypothetical protein
MNAPELAVRVQALVDASRVLDEPSTADRERVRARLAAVLGKAGPPVAAADGGSGGAASRANFRRLLGPSLLVMAVSATITGLLSREHASEPAARMLHAPATSRAPAVPAVGDQAVVSHPPPLAASAAPSSLGADAKHPSRAPNPRRAKKVQTRDPKPTTPPAATPAAEPETALAAAPIASARDAAAPSTSGLAAELALLREAQRALAARDLPRALELLDRHAQRYPQGSLVPERLAARAVTLCRMRRGEQGARELQALQSRAPQSPLISWARTYCQSATTR